MAEAVNNEELGNWPAGRSDASRRRMATIPGLMGLLPVAIPIAGRKRDLVVGVLDRLLIRPPLNSIVTDFGRFKIDMRVKPERYFYYCFYNMLRYYERSPLGQHMKRFSDGVFLDIGANLGAYSLVARAQGMRTVLIEPDPTHARFLSRNWRVFDKTIPVALGERETTMPMFYDESNPGGTSLCNALDYKRGEEVRVTTFDHLAEQGEFGPIEDLRLVKIDVEGFEVEAVAGMHDTLADPAFRPDLWIEVRGDTAGRAQGSFREVRSALADYGYRPITDRSEEDLAQDQVYDLLFVRS